MTKVAEGSEGSEKMMDTPAPLVLVQSEKASKVRGARGSEPCADLPLNFLPLCQERSTDCTAY